MMLSKAFGSDFWLYFAVGFEWILWQIQFDELTAFGVALLFCLWCPIFRARQLVGSDSLLQ